MEKATFGAGCFWEVEESFRLLNGVISTEVGYLGGRLVNPTYEDVCTDKTGHAEVVNIIFDESKITFEHLLDIFFRCHNPTTLNRQGDDIGTQYRSAIFYHSEEQKEAAIRKIKILNDKKVWKSSIVTTLEENSRFYKAEEYHQKYFLKNGVNHCQI